MNINKLLNGLNLGTRQEVGVMSVIPLIGKDISEKVAELSDVVFNGTSGYGNMVFTNKSDKPAIVPSGYSIFTEQKAQDHGLTFASLIAPNSNPTFNLACCIESTQPNYIDGSKITDFNILPLFIRKRHFEKYINVSANPNVDFRRLWVLITEFQGKLVEREDAHLIFFFNKFVDKLNKFNAEFEVVPNQRGAIIMINNKIVGIEITPTHSYWKLVWNKLIRDCYGSEVVRLTFLNLVNEFEKNQEKKINLDDCDSLADIEMAIKNHQTSEKDKANIEITNILSKEFKLIQSYKSLMDMFEYEDIEYKLFYSEGKEAFGELYEDNENVLYCSMLFS